jgi:hypothetical protein
MQAEEKGIDTGSSKIHVNRPSLNDKKKQNSN